MISQQKIGSRLQQVRKASKVTLVEIITNVPTSKNNLLYIERGKVRPSFDTIAALCQFYDISIDALAFDTDEQFEELLNDLRGVVYEVCANG